jgi:hypothetical protein
MRIVFFLFGYSLLIHGASVAQDRTQPTALNRLGSLVAKTERTGTFTMKELKRCFEGGFSGGQWRRCANFSAKPFPLFLMHAKRQWAVTNLFLRAGYKPSVLDVLKIDDLGAMWLIIQSIDCHKNENAAYIFLIDAIRLIACSSERDFHNLDSKDFVLLTGCLLMVPRDNQVAQDRLHTCFQQIMWKCINNGHVTLASFIINYGIEFKCRPSRSARWMDTPKRMEILTLLLTSGSSSLADVRFCPVHFFEYLSKPFCLCSTAQLIFMSGMHFLNNKKQATKSLVKFIEVGKMDIAAVLFKNGVDLPNHLTTLNALHAHCNYARFIAHVVSLSTNFPLLLYGSQSAGSTLMAIPLDVIRYIGYISGEISIDEQHLLR